MNCLFQKFTFFIAILLLLLISGSVGAQTKRPNLVLSFKDLNKIKGFLGNSTVFDKTFAEAKEIIEKALNNKIDVPIPIDAGGYTHERHKKNYIEMQLAGTLYAITNDTRYANFVKEMLLKYAELYPTLKEHPMKASSSPGRLFWQTLNETVWLVNAIQAYDCIYDWLSLKDRKIIEDNLFRKITNFFVYERGEDLDRIHNHGTWMCAAVGMTGYVLKDNDLIEKALYGSNKNGEAGFFKQLDELFSPDGYYTEGPYYIRYAMMPFFLFAQAIENNQPELKIFEYRDKILKKAFYCAMQLTYTNGAFIPINDALKEKNFLSPEVIVGLNITYKYYGEDPQLLSIARKQNTVLLNDAGLLVAKALKERVDIPEFKYESIEFSDGPNGKQGGLGILRYGDNLDQSLLLMKYTSHGLSHGHYDKLSFVYYDQNYEVIQDYGAVRFINVEPKFGGRYLPETKSFAMQTIAHNTVTVDENSHYDGKISISENYSPVKYFFSVQDSNTQIMSAKASNVYKGVEFHRTMAMVHDNLFIKPIVIDIFRINSKNYHQYDLPFYYIGQFVYTNVNYIAYDKEQKVFGTKNGYQHLWCEAKGTSDSVMIFTWLLGNRYYSLISNCKDRTEVNFVRIGGSDPNFNLRREPAIVLRRNAASTVFVNIIEPHGIWDGVKEFSTDSNGKIRDVTIIENNDTLSVIRISIKNMQDWHFFFVNNDSSISTKHSVLLRGKQYEWIGPYYLVKK